MAKRAELPLGEVKRLAALAEKAVSAYEIDDSIGGPDTSEYDEAVSNPDIVLALCRAYIAQQSEDGSPLRKLLEDAVFEAYSDAAADAQAGAKYIAPEDIHLSIETVEAALKAERTVQAFDLKCADCGGNDQVKALCASCAGGCTPQ